TLTPTPTPTLTLTLTLSRLLILILIFPRHVIEKKQRPRALLHARGPGWLLDCLERGFLVAAARLVDLQVARGDGHRGVGAGSDLHHDGAAIHDFQVEHIAAGTSLGVVDGPAFEGHGNL